MPGDFSGAVHLIPEFFQGLGKERWRCLRSTPLCRPVPGELRLKNPYTAGRNPQVGFCVCSITVSGCLPGLDSRPRPCYRACVKTGGGSRLSLVFPSGVFRHSVKTISPGRVFLSLAAKGGRGDTGRKTGLADYERNRGQIYRNWSDLSRYLLRVFLLNL